MYQIFLGLFIIVAIVLIILIMLQQDSNSSSGMFDSRSLGNILNVRSGTAGVDYVIVVLAILFFLFSLLLGNMNSKHNQMCVHNDQENTLKDK